MYFVEARIPLAEVPEMDGSASLRGQGSLRRLDRHAHFSSSDGRKVTLDVICRMMSWMSFCTCSGVFSDFGLDVGAAVDDDDLACEWRWSESVQLWSKPTRYAEHQGKRAPASLDV